MGKAVPKTAEKRNAKLVSLKGQGETFKDLAVRFDISEARAKEIYYREIRKMGRLPRRYQRKEDNK